MMRTAYPTKDNAVGVRVFENGVRREDLTAVTRCRVIFGGAEVDSDQTPTAFDLAFDDPDGNDVILLNFGVLAGPLPLGQWPAEIVIYEPDNSNGVVITESFLLRIEAAPSGALVTS